jgi:hypothetical protein
MPFILKHGRGHCRVGARVGRRVGTLDSAEDGKLLFSNFDLYLARCRPPIPVDGGNDISESLLLVLQLQFLLAMLVC